MEGLPSTFNRLRSESPTGVPPTCILEWNFMASRINAIVAVLRAHKRLNRPLDMQAIADGMQIEQAQAALISGRLAIVGDGVGSQPMYNHAMAFRHSVDRGQRVLQKLADEELLLPRWGSYSRTPPPVFRDLPRSAQTDTEEWQNFCGAAGLDASGTQWWMLGEPIALHEHPAVKAADAARVWFRLINRPRSANEVVPHPELARELRYIIAWLAGTQKSLASSTGNLDRVIDGVQARIHNAYVRERERVGPSEETMAAVPDDLSMSSSQSSESDDAR